MRILLTGASGQLGAYLLRAARGGELTAWSHTRSGSLFGHSLQPVDLADGATIARRFLESAPDVVLHAAAISRIDRCYTDPQHATRVNSDATARLAELADNRGARLVYVSTDMVFDGEKCSPYSEDDDPNPQSHYGRTKLAGERAVLGMPRASIARISLLVGPGQHGGQSFFDIQLQAIRKGAPLQLFVDEWRTPLDYATAAQALWELAMSESTGIWHIGGPERLSRWDIGQQLAQLLGVDAIGIQAIQRSDMIAPEPRPRDLSLDCSRWRRRFPHIRWQTWTEGVRPLLKETR